MSYNKAIRAYEDFTGHKPSHVDVYGLDDEDRIGYKMGQVLGIAYKAKRDGKVDQYFHKFKERSRPELVSSDDGKQLYIAGGSYKITDHGIEDVMPGLFVVNPSPRGGKRKKTMAVRRRRRRRAGGMFARNPAPRRRARRARAKRTTVVVRANPIRRRRRYRLNPSSHRRRRHSYRRNPVHSVRASLGGVDIGTLLIPGIFIGGGAVGAEVVAGYLPVPANWKTGYMKYVMKAGIGIGAGIVLAKFLRQRKIGEYMALGAIVTSAHDAIKDALTTTLPSVKMGMYTGVPHGGLGYASPAMLAGMGGMGEYGSVPVGALGYS